MIENKKLLKQKKKHPVLRCNAKMGGNDYSRVAKSLAAANKNKFKCSSSRCRNKGRELLTFGKPQVGRDLWQEISSPPLPTPK